MRFILASLLVLTTLGCLAAAWGEPSVDHESQRWRRTANGWERYEYWTPRVTPAAPVLHPVTVGALEVLLVLTIAAGVTSGVRPAKGRHAGPVTAPYWLRRENTPEGPHPRGSGVDFGQRPSQWQS
ncbi:MAG: hypothetical protein HY000_01990 [Planctomycetes bacterium]|nr:hypothetical protein [Planctomycetota bacterium]